MTRLSTLRKGLPPLKIPQGQEIKTFTCFPKLPLESQNHIWYHVAHEQRDIALYRVASVRTFYVKLAKENRNIPAILLTSHSARTEGLRYYRACSETSLGLVHYHFGALEYYMGPVREKYRLVYVNFAVDRFMYEERKVLAVDNAISKGEIRFNLSMGAVNQVKFINVKILDASSIGHVPQLFKLKEIQGMTINLGLGWDMYRSTPDSVGNTLFGKSKVDRLISLLKSRVDAPSDWEKVEVNVQLDAPQNFEVELVPCGVPLAHAFCRRAYRW